MLTPSSSQQTKGSERNQKSRADLTRAYLDRQPEGEKYFQRARQVLAGGVGHDLRHFEPIPLYIARGLAGRKWDVDGNEYVDFLMGNGALLLGHADPEINEAVIRALRDGSHFGSDHPLQIEWAEWIVRLVPSAERVRFVNSGTEANLLALRLARAYTKKPKVLRFEGHFHGWHDDVIHGFTLPFEADGTLGAAPQARANMIGIPDNDLNLLHDILRKHKDIAAAIIEPSGASWGRVPIKAEYLRGLREVTAEYGVILIFDEVVTGFRFSPGGAQQLYGVTPDLTCLAKVVAGGMPGGAVAGRADVMKLFDWSGDPHQDRHGRVVHLGTYNACPPSAAAGITALRRIANGQPIQQADRMAELLRKSWDGVLEKEGIAGYVYGPASTFHVYFEADAARLAEARSRKDLVNAEPRRLKGMPGELIAQYQRHLRFRGVDLMSSTGGVVSSAHTEADIALATEAFKQTIIALREEGLVFSL